MHYGSGARTGEIDIEALRRDTPGCASGLAHFNNAGAALMPAPVIAALRDHLDRESTLGGYEAEADAAPALQRFRDEAAALIGGAADEIAFMDSATRAWQAVFSAFDWKPGDEVITCSTEYASDMLALMQAQRQRGIRLRVAPDRPEGEVDAAALAAMIGPRTRLICISHMPTNDGLVNPVAEIGAAARAHGVPFLLDACQSVGQCPVDVAALGCTMLSATGRKYLRGPRGTGFLWVARDWAERHVPPGLDVQSAAWTGPESFAVAPAARRFELWERNVAGQIGLGVACAYARGIGLPAIAARIGMLAGHLRNALQDVAGVQVQDRGREKSGIVTFSCATIAPPELVARLRHEARINTSVSATQPTRRGLLDAGVAHLVRASVHAYNTVEEIDRLVESLHRLIGPLRHMPTAGRVRARPALQDDHTQQQGSLP